MNTVITLTLFIDLFNYYYLTMHLCAMCYLICMFVDLVLLYSAIQAAWRITHSFQKLCVNEIIVTNFKNCDSVDN